MVWGLTNGTGSAKLSCKWKATWKLTNFPKML